MLRGHVNGEGSENGNGWMAFRGLQKKMRENFLLCESIKCDKNEEKLFCGKRKKKATRNWNFCVKIAGGGKLSFNFEF
jgi:hypothetical protein